MFACVEKAGIVVAAAFMRRNANYTAAAAAEFGAGWNRRADAAHVAGA